MVEPVDPFVWHRVPTDMSGSVLYPLHALEHRFPEIFTQARAKYLEGREDVLDFRVPILGLLWNDFLHCSTVHPRLVHDAWVAAGFDLDGHAARPDAWLNGRFFQIPVSRFAGTPALWYTADDLTAPPESFSVFESGRYRPFTAVSEGYRAHVREAVAGNAPALMYFRSPHVLVAGPIDTTGLTVVDWREPLGEPA